MHLLDGFGLYRLQTYEKVKHKIFDPKTSKIITVNRQFQDPYLREAKIDDLTDLLKRNKVDIERTWGAKVNPKNKTVGKVSVRMRFSAFAQHIPTSKEIGCAKTHRWWRCELVKGKRKIITSFFHNGDNDCEAREEGIKSHRFFTPEETHEIPKNWVVRKGEKGVIQHNALPHKQRLELIKEAVQTNGIAWSDIISQFDFGITETIQAEYPMATKAPKELGAEILTLGLRPSDKVLYRLLHWSGKLNIKEGNFYKGDIHNLRLGKTGALACFYFYKKELAVALWCPKSKLLPEKPKKVPAIIVTCGVPGSANPYAPKATADVMEKWNFLIKLLKARTEIYSGNNFYV